MVSLRPGRWWWIFFKSKAINSEVNRNTETVIRSFLAAVGVGEYESPWLFTPAKAYCNKTSTDAYLALGIGS